MEFMKFQYFGRLNLFGLPRGLQIERKVIPWCHLDEVVSHCYNARARSVLLVLAKQQRL